MNVWSAPVFEGFTQNWFFADGSICIPRRFLEKAPARLRSLVVAVDVEQCLLMYPIDEWLHLQRRILSSWNHPGLGRLRKLIAGPVAKLTSDGDGLLRIPLRLRRRTGLEHSVLFVGYGNHLKLWNQQRWESHSLGWLEDRYVKDLRRLDKLEARGRRGEPESGSHWGPNSPAPSILR